MKKTISFILLALLAVFTLQTAKAQVLLTEDFDYTTGDTLINDGWIQQGTSTTNPILVVSPGLTYPGYIGAGNNNCTFLNNTGQDVYKPLPDTITDHVYASFLIKVTSAKVEPSAGDYFVHFIQDGTNLRGRLFARKNSSDKLAFNLTISGASTVGTWTNYDYDLDTTYLVVIEYEFNPNAKDDTIRLWINPTISTTEPTPTLTHGCGSTETDATMLTKFSLRQGSSANAPTVFVDGIRVAKTWTNLFYNTIDWANLQWPVSGSINQGENFVVYAQSYINGITNQAGATPGLECWIGYNSTDTDPSTWTNWVPATFNTQSSNNDEFMADLGAEITTPGTYYYASRWQYSAGQYYYGGLNDGFWDANLHPSGVLIVNEKPTIANVQHTPATPNSLENVDVSADITDDGTIKWANLYWSTSTITDTAAVNKVAMTLQSGNTYTAQIPAQANGTTVHYLVGASDNLDAINTSLETNYTVTNPTATITKAAWIKNDPNDIIAVIYDSKVPLAQASNYKLNIGNLILTPDNITIIEGATNDTVLLSFLTALPVDIVVDTIIDEFYGSQYEFYACLMPIRYTNAANSQVIQNNIPATFMGIVTADEEFKQVWIRDGIEEYKGVMVFDNSQALKDFVNVGDMITFVGTRAVYNDNTEIIPQAIIEVQTGGNQPIPVVIQAADLDYNIAANTNPAEKWEGQFVQINSLKIDSYNATYYEYTAYTCDGSQITIDDDAWYHYNSETPFTIDNIYNVAGVVTFTGGHYKLCPRSAADIYLTPFDIAEIDAPTNQIADGNADVSVYNNSSNAYEFFRFNLTEVSGVDGLPTIIDTLVLSIENETTADIVNDIAGIKFLKDNTTELTVTAGPVLESNTVKFTFGNGDFSASNGATAEFSIWLWFNASGEGKVIKMSVNTANQIALDPTCQSSPLKETDETVYSGTLTLIGPNNIGNVSKTLKLYPNPVSDVVCVNTEFSKVEIINTLGEIVKVVEANNIIDLSKLPQGIYTLKVFTNNEVITKQIIKK